MDVLAHDALRALAAAGRRVVEEEPPGAALDALAIAAAQATGADLAVIRVTDRRGLLRVRAVAAQSEALRAELEGSSYGLDQLPHAEVVALEELPDAVRKLATRTRANAALLLPVRPGASAASLELLREGEEFTLEEIALGRLAAAQLGLALAATTARNGGPVADGATAESLRIAGDALVAAYDHDRAGLQVALLASEAAGAAGAQLWRGTAPTELEALAASGGLVPGSGRDAAARALSAREAVTVERAEGGSVAHVRLGRPPLGVLQLQFSTPPSDGLVRGLEAFGIRAAHALRASERANATATDLERSQALLTVVGQAIAQLSLAHTVETAADRVAELLRSQRVAVYLREGGRLYAAHERGLVGPHAAVAERLLDVALGPARAQGVLHVSDAAADLRLAPVRDAVVEAGIEAVLAVPLLVADELIGIVAAYLPIGYVPSQEESALLSALAAQLAVAVQNARLHEDVKRLAAERERALDAEAARGRQLSALHDITSSFAASLSLQATLDAVVRAAAELLGADAAVVRVPDERGTFLVSGASYVADPRLAEPLRPLLERPQQAEGLPGRRLFRMGRALVLDAESARRLGSSYELLAPFLEQGSTAMVIPIATPAELLATLTIVSLDPARRISAADADTALAVAAQAALAIDNARLYQQQKRFADTMQRSLLPGQLPAIEQLDLGAVYESSARVDVGGDLYDFLPLRDGRLAAVLGDVSGHGVEATSGMALAKFAFRSLAREHPDPGDFLAHANEVVHQELTGGKFITMIYLAVNPEAGEVAAASAGHHPARLLAPDGSVSGLGPQGLALGVDPDQAYEELRAALPRGAAVCLYTDGILEARKGDDQYGTPRLDASLARGIGLSAQALAEHVVADCRAFAGGELTDDCAVVVIKRP